MGLIDTIAAAAKLAQKLDNIELNNTILQLQSQIMVLLADNQDLKERLADVAGELKRRRSVVFDPVLNAYFEHKPDGQRDGPFCSRCMDEHGRLMRLHDRYNGFQVCPSCSTSVKRGGRQ
jgi:hypothetical protein